MQNASICKYFIAITVFSGCSDGTPAPRSGVKYGCVTGSAKGTACSDNSKGGQNGNPPKDTPAETSNTQAAANPQAANQAGMLPAGQNQPTGNALQQLGQKHAPNSAGPNISQKVFRDVPDSPPDLSMRTT
jgi:hypothetical protein